MSKYFINIISNGVDTIIIISVIRIVFLFPDSVVSVAVV